MCGLVSILYFRLSKSAQSWFASQPRLQNPFLRILPLAMVYGIILIYLPQVFGVGYGTINDVLNVNFDYHMVLIMFWVKIIFMVLFIAAGAYGGTFAPALGLGAMTGFLFAETINTIFGLQLNPTAFALVGMGGVLSGMNSIPLTSIMLVFEVTNDYRFILPLMFVSIIAYLAVLYFNRHSVYTLKLMQEGIDVSGRSETDLLGKVAVRDLKHMDYDVASYKMPFRQLMQLLLESKHGDVFVVNDQGRVTGCVSLKEIRQALLDNELVDLLIAGDLAMKGPGVTDRDPVSEAMKKIGKYDIEHIPVVNNERDRRIVGSITHQTIIQATTVCLKNGRKTSLRLIIHTILTRKKNKLCHKTRQGFSGQCRTEKYFLTACGCKMAVNVNYANGADRVCGSGRKKNPRSKARVLFFSFWFCQPCGFFQSRASWREAGRRLFHRVSHPVAALGKEGSLFDFVFEHPVAGKLAILNTAQRFFHALFYFGPITKGPVT
jgi:CIC family chloride channel protein